MAGLREVIGDHRRVPDRERAPSPSPGPRRAFLRAGLGTAAGVLAGPWGAAVVAAPGAPRRAALERVTLGFIACGGRAGSLLGGFLGLGDCQVVAACDPFRDRREAFAARVNAHDGGTVCTPFQDFREMLEREDIDAVVIATPDHWHVPAAILAATAGKDVYVEKPLGLSIEQDHAVRAAVRRHGRVFQYGTQQRSMGHLRHACELVRNGRIGRLRHIEVVSPASSAGGSTEAIPAPEGFDYDLWLGPAPEAPYTRDRCTASGAYFIRDYALGFIAGWGAHPLDIAVWGLGDTAHAVPVELRGTGDFPSRGLYDTATRWDVSGRFADGVGFRFRGPGGDLTVFSGESGTVFASRGGLRTEPSHLKDSVIGADEVHLHRSPNHGQDFLDAIRLRRRSVSPVEVAVWSDTISHLGDIAIRTGHTVRWDPERECILDSPTAARLATRAMRSPWHL
ncbi:MAG: Gfo/Idh/MocA family oxidoreductase [Lentisphaeria bacterium]|nr:Gfo/Idh/MocA family oxidoreductase [Lentisphaeria bacterium]